MRGLGPDPVFRYNGRSACFATCAKWAATPRTGRPEAGHDVPNTTAVFLGRWSRVARHPMLLDSLVIDSRRRTSRAPFSPRRLAQAEDPYRIRARVAGFRDPQGQGAVRLVGTAQTELELPAPCWSRSGSRRRDVRSALLPRRRWRRRTSVKCRRGFRDQLLPPRTISISTNCYGSSFYLALPMKPLCSEGCLACARNAAPTSTPDRAAARRCGKIPDSRP